MTFTKMQTKQLLAPIRPPRVLKDGKNNSHVSQQDVTAHLIRVFGFGNFATELLELTLIDATCRNPGEEAYSRRKWDVTYRARMRVTIMRDTTTLMLPMDVRTIASYEDASTGSAQNQVLHDAHDLAMKSAVSLAKKRCCINLGDQFGLSLYNKGQMAPLVGGTLVLPEGWDGTPPEKDITENVPQQVSLGTDETVHDDHKTTSGEPEVTDEQRAMLAKTVGATEVKG